MSIEFAQEDLRRDAGLRGDAFDDAVMALLIVFILGIGIVVAVVLTGRRKRNAE